jgi:hypothetical protein
MNDAMIADHPTRLWTLERDGRTLACAVRLVPYGIEVDILQDGALRTTRSFATGDEALAWARERRAGREADGWQAAPVPPAADPSI